MSLFLILLCGDAPPSVPGAPEKQSSRPALTIDVGGSPVPPQAFADSLASSPSSGSFSAPGSSRSFSAEGTPRYNQEGCSVCVCSIGTPSYTVPPNLELPENLGPYVDTVYGASDSDDEDNQSPK